MSAIDFARLMREERKNVRRKKQEETAAATATELTTTTTPTTATASSSTPPPTAATAAAAAPSTWSFDYLPSHMYELQSLQQDNEEDDDGNVDGGSGGGLITRSTTITTDGTKNTHLVCRDPPFIFYVPECLHFKYQTQLLQWLFDSTQIPNNPIGLSSSSSNDPVQSNGTWTQMKYSGRRVALFDARIRPFPEPLATLAQQLSDHVFAHALSLSSSSLSSSTYSASTATTNNNNNNNNSSILPRGGINHILINDYTTHQVGIMPHTDGPAYEPCTATLSLGSKARFQFTKPAVMMMDTAAAASSNNNNNNGTNTTTTTTTTSPLPRQLILNPGSLVVFCHTAYSEWLHSIPPRTTTTTAATSTTSEQHQKQQPQQQESTTTTSTTVVNLIPPLPQTSSSNNDDEIMHWADYDDDEEDGRRLSLTFRIAR